MLVEETSKGLYCAAGGFYIDPWRGVDRALVTHGHADHARWGSKRYLTAASGRELVQARVGKDAVVESMAWGEHRTVGGVRVSFHPAGHILGSAQIRLEYRGEVTVVSGDYKTAPDATCEGFEPVRCHGFITESTFGLPIYRWPAQEQVFAEINTWWRQCQQQGKTAVLYAYALGKAQRILGGVDAGIGPILVHGAVHRFLDPYRAQGIALPPAEKATVENAKACRGRALLIAPPSAQGSTWLKKFGPVSHAFASGWMMVRGGRRRRAMDRGFVLSDHADWPGLLAAIEATGASEVGVTHGHGHALARWLQEQGRQARVLKTPYAGETGEDQEAGEVD
jgi:putative mRNA 3-end processing factor